MQRLQKSRHLILKNSLAKYKEKSSKKIMKKPITKEQRYKKSKFLGLIFHKCFRLRLLQWRKASLTKAREKLHPKVKLKLQAKVLRALFRGIMSSIKLSFIQ